MWENNNIDLQSQRIPIDLLKAGSLGESMQEVSELLDYCYVHVQIQ